MSGHTITNEKRGQRIPAKMDRAPRNNLPVTGYQVVDLLQRLAPFDTNGV